MEEVVFYKVNEYITLKLENGKTNIYINGKRFRQCIYLLLNIPKDKVQETWKYNSIDEAAANLDTSLQQPSISQITPFEEFKGHCSNLQVWVEYNYDTRLLRINLAFPLLKKLTEVGDPVARKVFKEEIASRFNSGHSPTLIYLLNEQYLQYLSSEEQFLLFENINFSKLEQYNVINCLIILRELHNLGFLRVKSYFKKLVSNLFTKLFLLKGI